MTFDFYIGGFFYDHSYRLILNGSKLSISDYIGLPIPEHAKTLSVHDNIGWQKLNEFLKCCKWKKRYDSGMLDGTQWELKAKGVSISIDTYGSNAYPDDFDEFLALVNRVVEAAGVSILK